MQTHGSVDKYIHDDQQNEGDEAEDDEVGVDQIELDVVRVEPHLRGLNAQEKVWARLWLWTWYVDVRHVDHRG